MSMECVKNPVFVLAEYNLPETLQAVSTLVGDHSFIIIVQDKVLFSTENWIFFSYFFTKTYIVGTH